MTLSWNCCIARNSKIMTRYGNLGSFKNFDINFSEKLVVFVVKLDYSGLLVNIRGTPTRASKNSEPYQKILNAKIGCIYLKNKIILIQIMMRFPSHSFYDRLSHFLALSPIALCSFMGSLLWYILLFFISVNVAVSAEISYIEVIGCLGALLRNQKLRSKLSTKFWKENCVL